jgi:hypothetical protein
MAAGVFFSLLLVRESAIAESPLRFVVKFFSTFIIFILAAATVKPVGALAAKGIIVPK